MKDQYQKPVGLAALDDMISRAEAACERGRRWLEPGRVTRGPELKGQQAMERTLARLQKQRESVTAERERRRKGAP